MKMFGPICLTHYHTYPTPSLGGAASMCVPTLLTIKNGRVLVSNIYTPFPTHNPHPTAYYVPNNYTHESTAFIDSV